MSTLLFTSFVRIDSLKILGRAWAYKFAELIHLLTDYLRERALAGIANGNCPQWGSNFVSHPA